MAEITGAHIGANNTIAQDVLDEMCEMWISTYIFGLEKGAHFCSQDGKHIDSLGSRCTGDACAIVINDCEGQDTIGDFHTHPSGGIGMSWADQFSAMWNAYAKNRLGPYCRLGPELVCESIKDKNSLRPAPPKSELAKDLKKMESQWNDMSSEPADREMSEKWFDHWGAWPLGERYLDRRSEEITCDRPSDDEIKEHILEISERREKESKASVGKIEQELQRLDVRIQTSPPGDSRRALVAKAQEEWRARQGKALEIYNEIQNLMHFASPATLPEYRKPPLAPDDEFWGYYAKFPITLSKFPWWDKLNAVSQSLTDEMFALHDAGMDADRKLRRERKDNG